MYYMIEIFCARAFEVSGVDGLSPGVCVCVCVCMCVLSQVFNFLLLCPSISKLEHSTYVETVKRMYR